MEELVASSVIARSIAVASYVLPAEASRHLISVILSRCNEALKLLALSVRSVAWLGGSTYQRDIFRFCFSCIDAAVAISSLKIVELEPLKRDVYQLLRTFNALDNLGSPKDAITQSTTTVESEQLPEAEIISETSHMRAPLMIAGSTADPSLNPMLMNLMKELLRG